MPIDGQGRAEECDLAPVGETELLGAVEDDIDADGAQLVVIDEKLAIEPRVDERRDAARVRKNGDIEYRHPLFIEMPVHHRHQATSRGTPIRTVYARVPGNRA